MVLFLKKSFFILSIFLFWVPKITPLKNMETNKIEKKRIKINGIIFHSDLFGHP